MREKFMNSRFACLYLWMTKAKYTMGLFYVFYVFMYLLFGQLAVRPALALDFATSIEMVFACFFIGVAQQALVPVDKLSAKRCTAWVAVSTLITLIFCLLFGWFTPLPLWCLVLFVALMAVGMAVLLLSYYLELRRETDLLNRQLSQFQHDTTPKTAKNGGTESWQ